jgi:hypothetical protein
VYTLSKLLSPSFPTSLFKSPVLSKDSSSFVYLPLLLAGEWVVLFQIELLLSRFVPTYRLCHLFQLWC